MAFDTNGLFEFIAGIIPTNLNPRTWITRSEYIHGGTQVFQTVDELIEFHPLKMKKGMAATVVDYPGGGVNTTYVLNTAPELLLDGAEASIITTENWRTVWDEQTTISTSRDVVYQYTTNYNGGIPPFPYTSDEGLENEKNWVATLDKSKSHKWYRQRDSDKKTTYNLPTPPNDPIEVYDNWSRPLPVGNQYETGDYIENRFKREDVDQTLISDPNNLILDKFYSVLSGQVNITRDSDGAEFPNSVGARFQKRTGFTYTFDPSTTCVQIVDIPPRTLPSGAPNNEPQGWTDSIPATPTGEQLWKIFAQKTIYGNLKSAWNLEKINESPETIRYSNKANPLPSTLMGVNDSVFDPDPANPPNDYDQTLIDNGWQNVFEEGFTSFIATRRDDGGSPPWTEWAVEKIGDESGEYTDYVYKLFPLNADYDGVAVDKPTSSDPSNQGWQDAPIEETSTDINWVSKARKFLDGTLKTDWSDPIPYTGADSFADVIRLPDGNDFKYDPNSGTPDVPVPIEVRLVAELVKGVNQLWKDPSVALTFSWVKTFDDGTDIADIPIVSTNPADDAYLKTTANGTFTPEEIAQGYRDGQILVIKADYITGKAYFQLTQTLTTPDGDVVFTEITDVLDITDGKDRRALEGSPDARLVLYDTGSTLFVPNNVQIVAFYSNLPEVTDFFWYFNNGAGYTPITGVEPNYTISGAKSSLLGIVIDDGAGSVLFTPDVSAESIQYAVSTHPTDPTLADGDANISDYITITKSEVSVIGEASKVAILSNEAYTAVLDNTTSPPNAFAGELGASGNAQTEVSVFNGGTQLSYTSSEFTVTQKSITAGFTATIDQSPTVTENARVYLNDPWATNGARSCKVVLEIVVTSDGTVIEKEFTIASTLDAPGALLLDIDSNKGFVFDRTPDGLDPKILTAFLYNVQGQTQVTEDPNLYYYEWSGAVTKSWNQGGVGGGDVSPSIVRTDIYSNGDIVCKVSDSPTGVPLLRQATVRISDITDAKTYRLYSTEVSQPVKPVDTTTPEAAQGVWSPDSTNAIWASTGTEKAGGNNPPIYEFSQGVKISGEKGEPGESGGFLLTMFKNSPQGTPATTPSRTSTLTQMETDGWDYKAPLAVGGQYLWTVQRSWKAFQADGVTPVNYDVNDKPDTQPMAGSQWSIPSQVSGFDGINGDFIEFRYAKNTSASTPPSLNTTSRAPSGWSTTYPSRSSGEYIWETKALINGTTDALETNWSPATLKTGEVGAKGDKGDKGDKGNKGDPGNDGFILGAVSITGGTCNSNGFQARQWGYLNTTTQRTSQGVYTIFHQIGNTNFSPVITSVQTDRFPTVLAISSTECQVLMHDPNGDFKDGTFFYHLIAF